MLPNSKVPTPFSKLIYFCIFVLQAGPLRGVNIPEDKPYGFVQFKHKSSVNYALQIYEGTVLFGQELKLDYGNKKKNYYNNQESQRMQHIQRRAKERIDSYIEEPTLKERRKRKHSDSYSSNGQELTHYRPAKHLNESVLPLNEKVFPRDSKDNSFNHKSPSESNNHLIKRRKRTCDDRDADHKHQEKRSRHHHYDSERYGENRKRSYGHDRDSHRHSMDDSYQRNCCDDRYADHKHQQEKRSKHHYYYSERYGENRERSYGHDRDSHHHSKDDSYHRQHRSRTNEKDLKDARQRSYNSHSHRENERGK